MSSSSQIFICVNILCYLTVTPATPLFQGIKVQKGFDIEFKPFTFKPISFIREKWFPIIGSFGVRKGIQKRDLGGEVVTTVAPISPAPVHEPLEEINPTNTEQRPAVRELTSGADPVSSRESNLIRIPVTETFKQPTDGLYTNIAPVPPVSSNLIERPAEVMLDGIYGELPPRPVGPIPARIPVAQVPFVQTVNAQRPFGPFSPVGPIAQEAFGQGPIARGPVPAGSPVAQGGFIQNPFGQLFIPSGDPIAQGPLTQLTITPGSSIPQASFPMNVIPLITPPPPVSEATPKVPLQEIPPTEGPLVRGSRIAVYLGKSLMKMISQFIADAKLQFSQFSNPPPPSAVPPSTS